MKKNDKDRKHASPAGEISTPATPENLAAADQHPTGSADADDYSAVDTDHYHESHVGSVRRGKGFLVELAATAAALCQIKSIVGDEFYEFARRRMGLTPTMADFLLRVAEMGIDPARYSPAVEVKLPAVMGTIARITDTWATTTSGTTTGTSGATDTTTASDTAATASTAATATSAPSTPGPPVVPRLGRAETIVTDIGVGHNVTSPIVIDIGVGHNVTSPISVGGLCL